MVVEVTRDVSEDSRSLIAELQTGVASEVRCTPGNLPRRPETGNRVIIPFTLSCALQMVGSEQGLMD